MEGKPTKKSLHIEGTGVVRSEFEKNQVEKA